MSLINKMLSDLEERHNYFKDEEQLILGGLAPVSNTGFTKSRLPVNFFLVCFFLLTVVIALYGYLEKIPDIPDVSYESIRLTDLTDNGLSMVAGQKLPSVDLINKTSIDGGSLSGLKLDQKLPFEQEEQPQFEAGSTGIRGINIAPSDSSTLLEIQLDGNPDYQVYTLVDPDRVVIEISDAQLLTSLPEAFDHPYIKQLQVNNTAGNILSLVVSMSTPVEIENTRLAEDYGIFRLSVSIVDQLKNTTLDLVKTFDETQKQVQSDFGKMNITPSSSYSEINHERLMNEARGLYSSREFARADEKMIKLLELDPLHTQGRILFSSSLVNRGNLSVAQQVLKAGLQINPGIAEWAEMYARLLVNQGETRQAIEILSGAFPEISTNADYYALYAALLQRESRHKEASELYKTLLNLQPNNGLWWMGLAISQKFLELNAEALYSFKKSRESQTLDYELTQFVSQQIALLSK
jgi:tetratricopeptide (TPR) repeat protein